MTILIPAYLIGAGIALCSAIQAFVIGLVRKRVTTYLVFGATGLGVSGLLLSSAVYHSAGSLLMAASALRWMAVCTYLVLPAFFLFVCLYTRRESTRGFGIVALFFAVLLVVNAVSPYSIRFSTLAHEPPLRFPWGEELATFSGTLTAWGAIGRAGLLILFGWALWRAFVHFRSGQHRQGLFLGGYLILQLAGLIWGGLIEAGILRSFLVAPFAFLVLVLFMSVSMGIDLRDQNLQIERLVVEWKETFDSVRTPIIVTDARGLVIRANRAACEISNIGNAPILGVPISALGDGEPWQTATQLVQHMAGHLGATSDETKDDSGRTWDLTIAPFSSVEAAMERFILVIWEITGIVDLQEALRRNETMSAMGALLAGVAHEVRNPLFGISATLDAYAVELDQPGYAACAEALRTEVDRLKHLMQELLDYGRPGMMTIEEGSIAEVVAQAIDGRRTRDSSVAVVNDVEHTLPLLLMDPARLQRVFENLIDNAAQHSPVNGVVSTRARVVEHAGRTWIECTVEDSGPGFDAESIERAFEPFFTKRQGGTGLGLSIVQRIVEEHSGNVVASNGPGGGALIRVRLPVAEA